MEAQSPVREKGLLTKIFFSPDQSRLRAGWRLLIQTLILIILIILIGTPVALLALGFFGRLPFTAEFAINLIVELIAVTISILLVRRFLDKLSFQSLGFEPGRRALFDILAGILITFVMMGSIFAVMQVMGWVHFSSFAWSTEPWPWVVLNGCLYFFIFILVGWSEELLSRGYHLQTIASGTNLFWGVLLSASIFGLLHIFNPDATWVSTAGIFFAGLFLAYGYVRTRQLWLSIGLHIGWNFFEGVVFGFPVSGFPIYPISRITVTGPDIWTGGAFGPEAGLIVLPALAVGLGLIHLYSLARNKASAGAPGRS